jgi:hypothetical protein
VEKSKRNRNKGKSVDRIVDRSFSDRKANDYIYELKENISGVH